jgi:hypothetical protein
MREVANQLLFVHACACDKLRVRKKLTRPTHTLAGERLNDLYAFDLANLAWIDLSIPAAGEPPPPRSSGGLAEAGGKLYVHGGLGEIGAEAIIASGVRACLS